MVILLWVDYLVLVFLVVVLIYGIVGGVEMLVFYLVGKVMDRKGCLWVVIFLLIMMGILLLLMFFIIGVYMLLLVVVVVGFGNGIGLGLIMMLGVDYLFCYGCVYFFGVWCLMVDLGFMVGFVLFLFMIVLLILGVVIGVIGLLVFVVVV